MPADARVHVLLPVRRAGGAYRLVVPSGTPAGGIWGHLPRELAVGGPPDGVRYILNDRRTIPGAPLRDGDTLVVAAPTDQETTHASA